jgi:hypothetical protein
MALAIALEGEGVRHDFGNATRRLLKTAVNILF